MNRRARRIRIRVAGVVVCDGTILLVKHRKKEQEYWLLPGGGVDSGEALGNALSRELWEELKIKVRVGDVLCVNDSIPPDGSRHIVNLYLRADITDGLPELGDDPRIVDFAWHPLESLKDIALFPAIGPELLEILLQKSEGAPYLGALWKES